MQPHDYQLRGKEFWLKHPRAYFAVDMGLGKTLTTLLALKEIGKPALIIAPVRTIHTTWPEEIIKWGFDFDFEVIHGKDKAAALKRKADIYITNFETIPFIYAQLVSLVEKKKPLPFEVCVIDEGSMIKSSSTQRFKYLKALRNVFPKYRLILSGTPAPNSLMDLWSQYFWLTDGKALGQRITHFRNKYFTHVKQAFSWNLNEGSDQKIYKAIAPYTFRLDAKDHIKLPKLIKNEIKLKLPKKLESQYKELEANFFLELNGVEHEAFNKASLSMKLRQFIQGGLYYEREDNSTTSNSSSNTKFDKQKCVVQRTSGSEKGTRGTTYIHDIKLRALKELVDETPGPVLATIQFRFELDIIKKQYPDVPVIAGGTSAKVAAGYIKEWNKGNIPLLVCHPASISHGVNLQSGGCTICWYGMTWSLEQYLQFNARLHRQGQKNAVVVHHLLVEGTVDEKVYKAIAKKNMNQRKLLDYLRSIS